MTAKFIGAVFVLAFLGFCAEGLAQEQPWQQEVLEAHNALRSKHCVPPLTWDAEVAAGAQKWADRCVFEHEPQGGPGESLGGQNPGDPNDTVADVVGRWYAEGEAERYDFSNPDPQQWAKIGHFAQVLWRDEKLLGCGRATCPGTIFNFPPEFPTAFVWVCRYSPRSPMNSGSPEAFKQNVLDPTKCKSAAAPAPEPAAAPGAASKAPAPEAEEPPPEAAPAPEAPAAQEATPSAEEEGAPTVEESQAPTPTGYFKLQTAFLESQNKCLEGNQVAKGAMLGGASFMATCSNASGQTWKMVPAEPGYFELQTAFLESKNKCLQGSEDEVLGAAAFMATCDDGWGQLWKMVPTKAGYFKLQTKFFESDNMCLEGNQEGGTLGGAAFMAPCSNAGGQKWKMVRGSTAPPAAEGGAAPPAVQEPGADGQED